MIAESALDIIVNHSSNHKNRYIVYADLFGFFYNNYRGLLLWRLHLICVRNGFGHLQRT